MHMGAYNCILAEPNFDFLHFILFPALPNSGDTRERLSGNLKMRRFERIHDVVEPVEAYRRGGYHPVHLHDIFNQRYEVIGKLAYGQFSTVWLANDQL